MLCVGFFWIVSDTSCCISSVLIQVCHSCRNCLEDACWCAFAKMVILSESSFVKDMRYVVIVVFVVVVVVVLMFWWILTKKHFNFVLGLFVL